MTLTGLVLALLLLQPLCCCSTQQQHSSSREQNARTPIVLTDTVAVTGAQIVGQAVERADSRTVVDCSRLQSKPAYLVRCVSAAYTGVYKLPVVIDVQLDLFPDKHLQQANCRRHCTCQGLLLCCCLLCIPADKVAYCCRM